MMIYGSYQYHLQILYMIKYMFNIKLIFRYQYQMVMELISMACGTALDGPSKKQAQTHPGMARFKFREQQHHRKLHYQDDYK